METQRTLLEHKPHTTRSPGAWVLAAGACSLLLALLAWDAAAQTPAPQEPPPTPAPSPKPAATFSAGSWAFKLGGYVKLDAIHDFDPIGSTDSFNPRTIPVPGGEGTNTRFHARESRVSLAVVGPVEGRDLKLVVEGDFYGANNGIRLRHAYGQYGLLLAGQTWTTFMDEDNIPNTIDFETPLSQPLVRQGLVRFTFDLSKRTLLAFGIEDSDPRLLPPPGVEGTTEKALPDFTARLRFTTGPGHVQLSGFVGQTRFRPTTGDPTDVTIGGVLASARFRVFPRDSAYAQVSWGPGLGRYRGDLSVMPDASGELRAVEVTAFLVGYEHYWTSRWSSNVVVSPAWLGNDPGEALAPDHRFDYVAVNLRYWFIENRAWAGVEYLYGRKEVRSGEQGSANRVQFAVRFNIPG